MISPRRFYLASLAMVALAAGFACAPATVETPGEATPRTIVFVHGAWGGGWQYTKVQPLLTFTEPIVLSNPVAAQLPAVFLLTVEAGKKVDDFDVFADRARRRGWQVVEMEGSHNPHWFQPEAFVEVFLDTLE